MKNLFAYFALCLTVVFGLAVSSCGTNLCKDVDCGTHGTCDEADGKCACTTGYENNKAGTCDSVSRDKFIATYNVVDICPSGTYNYTSEIATSSTGIDKVIIKRYGGYEAGASVLEVPATVEGNKISVATQTITFNGQSFAITAANATLTGSSFSLTYTVAIDGGAAETCAATFTKQ